MRCRPKPRRVTLPCVRSSSSAALARWRCCDDGHSRRHMDFRTSRARSDFRLIDGGNPLARPVSDNQSPALLPQDMSFRLGMQLAPGCGPVQARLAPLSRHDPGHHAGAEHRGTVASPAAIRSHMTGSITGRSTTALRESSRHVLRHPKPDRAYRAARQPQQQELPRLPRGQPQGQSQDP